jgi:hypothetical protein
MADGEGPSTLKIVGITCGVIAALAFCGVSSCLVCAGGGIGAVFVTTEAAAEESRAFITDVRGHDYPAAYARMSAGYRSAHTLEEFQSAVEAAPALAENTSASILNRQIINAEVRISGELVHPGGTDPFTLVLIQEENHMRISAIEIDGVRIE